MDGSRTWMTIALSVALGAATAPIASANHRLPPTDAATTQPVVVQRPHGLLAGWGTPATQQQVAPDYPVATVSGITEIGGTAPESCDLCVDDCCVPLWQHRNSVFAEALYLRPGNVDVVYAIEQTGPLVTDSPTGPVGRVGLDSELGFRIGFAHAMSDCSSIVATYTWFDSDTTDFISAAPGNVLALNVGNPAVPNVAATSIESTADYRIAFQQVDLDYRRLLYGDQNSALNYFAGLRYANLEQEFTAAQVTGVAAGLTTVETDINFDGFGLGFGLDGERRSEYSGLLVYAKGSASFVSGEFKASFAQANQFGAGPLIRNELEDYRVISILQTELGGGWMSCNGRFRLTAGYQFAGWFNTLTTGSYIDGVQAGGYTDLAETMTFDGLVTRLEVRY